MSTPMRRIRSPCCARAASGHAAAAPPRNAMNSDQLTVVADTPSLASRIHDSGRRPTSTPLNFRGKLRVAILLLVVG